MSRSALPAAVLLSSALIAAAAIISHAGNLNPPAGPITPTLKTLDQVEPRIPIGPDTTPGDADALYKISNSGSYYLADNLVGHPGKHGIEIDADGVSLDLGGFVLTGVPGSLDAVHVADGQGITASNAIIRSWDGDGVDATGAEDVQIDRFVITRCLQGAGVRVGISARIADTAVSTCQNGFVTLDHCILDRCRATESLGDRGFSLGNNNVVTDCIASQGLDAGFFAAEGSILSHCTAVSNSGHGFIVSIGAVLENCTSRLNEIGFNPHGATLENCAASENQSYGVFGNDSKLNNCRVSNNNTGINLADSVITNCHVAANALNGLTINNSTVQSCTVIENGLHGIATSGDPSSNCLILDNTCVDNGESGIYVTQFRNRIDGNNCRNNLKGIVVDAIANHVTRNVCDGNLGGNYDLDPAINATVSPDPSTAGPWDNHSL